MARKSHARKHIRKHENLQEGFISNSIQKSMNKNEKIIMGIFVGGIVTFIILSIIVLFGKGKNDVGTKNPSGFAPTPTIKILTTPYPTMPPVTDFYMQVNETMFYPQEVAITKGHTVTILNIGKASTTITPTTKINGYDFGAIANSEEKVVMFDKPGVYRYTRTGKPDQILTITVK